MSSTPKAIRQALVALLIAAGTDAGSRVYSSRYYPDAGPFPSLAVWAKNGRHLEYTDAATRQEQRDLELVIEAVVVANENADDDLDDLVRQVVLAVHADPLLGATLQQFVQEDIAIEPGEAGVDPKVLKAFIAYRAEYHDLMT